MGRDFMEEGEVAGSRDAPVRRHRRTYRELLAARGVRRRALVNSRWATSAQQLGKGRADRKSLLGRALSPGDRLLRREEVETRCGIARSTIYRLMNEGRFPRPLRIGGRTVRWLASDITRWLVSLPRVAG